MYSSLKIFKNPNTNEYASMFIHNIRTIIVTDTITIHCDSTNKGYKVLEQLGFTENMHQGAGVSI